MEKAAAFAPDGLRYHFIGRLSSRRARKVARQAMLIHTLDSLRLARKLSLIAQEERREVRALVQVNQGGEATKGGVAPAAAAALVHDTAALPGLRVIGLMSIPPFDDRPRDWFRQLRELRDAAAAETGVALPELSMGMSHDFAEAIVEGATLVRVGTDAGVDGIGYCYVGHKGGRLATLAPSGSESRTQTSSPLRGARAHGGSARPPGRGTCSALLQSCLGRSPSRWATFRRAGAAVFGARWSHRGPHRVPQRQRAKVEGSAAWGCLACKPGLGSSPSLGTQPPPKTARAQRWLAGELDPTHRLPK